MAEVVDVPPFPLKKRQANYILTYRTRTGFSIYTVHNVLVQISIIDDMVPCTLVA